MSPAPPVPRVDTANLETKAAHQFVAAWDRWRGGETLPLRQQLILDDIKSLLPLTMLLEVQSEEKIIFRLAGSMIDGFLGVPVTGKNYLDYAPPPHNAIRAERMRRQADHPCGARSVLAMKVSGKYELRIELIALPVRPDDPVLPMQLICLASPIGDRLVVADPTMAPLRGGAALYQYFDIGAGTPDAPA